MRVNSAHRALQPRFAPESGIPNPVRGFPCRTDSVRGGGGRPCSGWRHLYSAWAFCICTLLALGWGCRRPPFAPCSLIGQEASPLFPAIWRAGLVNQREGVSPRAPSPCREIR